MELPNLYIDQPFVLRDVILENEDFQCFAEHIGGRVVDRRDGCPGTGLWYSGEFFEVRCSEVKEDKKNIFWHHEQHIFFKPAKLFMTTRLFQYLKDVLKKDEVLCNIRVSSLEFDMVLIAASDVDRIIFVDQVSK
ncbi:unnamed protein product [Amoebophrya sp. A25]|nr:unnamed protein product [Amoebophrya sp. A25]|eukprot:GSA25T00004605001.1